MNEFGRLSALACMAALWFPLGARAQCQQWDATGGWHAIQSNITVDGDDTQPVFSLEQSGSELRGAASFHRAARGEGDLEHQASVDGTIKQGAIELTAYWDDGSIGVYSGTINSLGRAEGESYDRLNPGNRAHWYSDRRFNCLAVAPAAAPTVLLGRVPSTTPRDPSKTICDYAKSARERNSPAAPTLEKRCAAYKSSLAPAAPAATEAKEDHSAINALFHPDPTVAPAPLPPPDPP